MQAQPPFSITFLGLSCHALTSRPRPAAFARNEEALRSLGITSREYEVLTHLAGGRSNKEIAMDLVLSEKTVKTHVSNILAKLHLADRTQAALYAVRQRIVDPNAGT